MHFSTSELSGLSSGHHRLLPDAGYDDVQLVPDDLPVRRRRPRLRLLQPPGAKEDSARRLNGALSLAGAVTSVAAVTVVAALLAALWADESGRGRAGSSDGGDRDGGNRDGGDGGVPASLALLLVSGSDCVIIAGSSDML